MRLRVVTISCVLLVLAACGDDDDSAADGGKDSGASETPRARRDAGVAGAGGNRAGASGASGAGGTAGKPDAGESEDGGSDGLQSVTIRFRSKLGDLPLTCGKSYTLPGVEGASITPTDFRFYVEDVRLVTASGHEESVVFGDRAPVQTRDVVLIDFTNDDGHCGTGTTAENTTITGKVAPGTYTSIVFVNGVPETVNHQDITTAEPPLDDPTTNWGWTTGYRFILTGIQVDPTEVAEADAGAPAGGISFVHVGAGGCAGSTKGGFTCARPNRNRIALSGFDPDTSVIVADLAKVFANVDLSKPLECHGPSSPACGPAYTALGLNAADGTARDTQEVFRVE